MPRYTKNIYSYNIINITAPPSPSPLLLRDDSGDGRRSLLSALILSVFLTVSMFPSVVSPPANLECVSDRLVDFPSVLTDYPPL